MTVKKLIAKASHVSYDVKLGYIKGDSEKPSSVEHLRPKKISSDFPDLYFTEHGKATFIKGEKPIILIDGAVSPESSFVYQLQKIINPNYIKSLTDAASLYGSDIKSPKNGAILDENKNTLLNCDVFVACNEGSGTWGHWFGQILPMVIEFLKFYPDGKVLIPEDYFTNYYFKKFGELALMAGVDSKSFVHAGNGEIFEIENLVTSDYFFSQGVFHPQSIENLNCLMLKSIKKNRKIFMQRLNNHEKRNITNFQEIEYINNENKIEEFSSGSSDLLTQQNVWAESSLNIGVLGSDFTNMFFGTPGRVMLITPSWFGDNFFYGLAAALGYEWNEVFCHTLIEQRNPMHSSSFSVNPDLYREMIKSI